MERPEPSDRAVRMAGALLRSRWLVRAPIWLYRARLGFLFGRRLLMLEHLGRTTGARRYVVLEVVDRPAPDRYYVASGFGMKAQWLRNVLHDPRVRVQLGGRRPAPATATLAGPEESGAVLRRYAVRHPRSWERLRPVFEETLGTPITEEGTSLPIVRLDVRGA